MVVKNASHKKKKKQTNKQTKKNKQKTKQKTTERQRVAAYRMALIKMVGLVYAY